MFCLVRHLSIISTSVIDCLRRYVSEMIYYVLSGALNLTNLLTKFVIVIIITIKIFVYRHMPVITSEHYWYLINNILTVAKSSSVHEDIVTRLNVALCSYKSGVWNLLAEKCC